MPEIVKTDDVLGGDPRIEGHCLGVNRVYQRYVKADDTPEEITTSYGISVADVHAALTYAFSHSVYEELAANRLVPDETT
jgi:uncharacterized protein (DUF433 family)